MGQYFCREDDAEDLTEQVKRLVNDSGSAVAGVIFFAVRGEKHSSSPWEVIAVCSKGHKNVFEGEGEP